MYKFELDKSQLAKFAVWEKEIYKKGIELQKKKMPKPEKHVEMCWDMGFPYSGAMGGQFTWCFTPTSVGVIAVVKDAITDEQIDLTNWDHW